MIQYQQVEVVAEFTRNVLEKTGYRMSMDATVVFLIGSRAGQMVSSGQSLPQVDLALTDLFVRPSGYQPLKSFWSPFHPGKISQIRSIKAIVNEMSELQVGSRLVYSNVAWIADGGDSYWICPTSVVNLYPHVRSSG